jgi:hypothetical protein
MANADMERLEADCDVLVCLLNRRGTQIPGKLYHYAATNKPILVILDGERAPDIETYLQRFARFVCCANEANAIQLAVEQLAASNRQYMPAPAFAAGEIAKQFLKND